MPSSIRPNAPNKVSSLLLLPKFLNNPLKFFEYITKKFGDVSKCHFGNESLIITTKPSILYKILGDRGENYHKDPISVDIFSNFLGTNLLNSNSKEWEFRRKTLAPFFPPKKIANYIDIMTEVATEFTQTIQSGKSYDIHDLSQKLMLEIFSNSFLEENLTNEEISSINNSMNIVQHSMVALIQSWQRLAPSWCPVPARTNLKMVSEKFDDMIYGMIAKKQKNSPRQTDLISYLLNRSYDYKQIDKSYIRDEIATLLIAGHETTALVLTYALYLIAKHPETLLALKQEWNQHIGQKRISFENMQNLSLTRGFIYEVMRLYPPIWLIGRQAIRNHEMEGYCIYKGEQVLIPAWITHRDENWFTDPNTFQPSRWLTQTPKDLPRHVYFPFGAGPRICIGQHFAMMELTVILITFLRNLEFKPPSPDDLKLKTTITLTLKEPLFMKIV